MNATKTKTWAVYVADDGGWLDGCPDFQGVFFGTIPATGRMVFARDGSELGGHVEFSDLEEAHAFCAQLNDSGDWTVQAPNHPQYGQVTRPEYAVTEVDPTPTVFYCVEVLRECGWTIVGQYFTEKQAQVIAADYRAHGEAARVVLN